MGIKHYLCGVLNHSFNPSHIVRKNGERFSDSQKQKRGCLIVETASAYLTKTII